MAPSKRAVGLVRVSRVGDRGGERFVSPSQQRERIASACQRDGLELVDTLEELDVSGGAVLKHRPGLLRAVEMIESGEMSSSPRTSTASSARSGSRTSSVTRMEQAGGQVLEPRGE
jgi:Resolvase, N terminal domain